jgi:hypothetical protein
MKNRPKTVHQPVAGTPILGGTRLDLVDRSSVGNQAFRQHLSIRRGHQNGTIDEPIHQNLFDLCARSHRLDGMG